MEPVDSKLWLRFEAREERKAVWRDKLLLEATLQIDRAPNKHDRVIVTSSRLRNAALNEKGRIFWKGINQHHRATAGLKMEKDNRIVYLSVLNIKKIPEERF